MDISQYNDDIQKLIVDMQDSRGKDPRVTISCGQKLLDYGISNSDPELIGFARFSMGETYYLMNDIANFYREMTLCMEPLEQIHEWGYLAMANNMLGIMSLNRGNAPFAMDYYMRAMQLCQDYSLPDLGWMVHLNMGALYLGISDGLNAIFHYQKGFNYIIANPDMDGYISNLTVALVGLGKAHLLLSETDRAKEYHDMLISSCMPEATSIEKLVISCFNARVFSELNDMDNFHECVAVIREHFSEEVPVMDVFDDVYDFMSLLLSMGEYEVFLFILDLMDKTIDTTGIKNLKKKLLVLRMKYYKETGQQEAYEKSGVLYFELSMALDSENDRMIVDTIALRHRLDDLTGLTKEVKRENEVLLKKSETDPLTGMYNRHKLNSYGDTAFERARKTKSGFAIEILDIDYFKEYNDNYGHQAGDRCIKFVADCIMQLRDYPGVFCSRYGGDEFVLIYEGYTDKEVFEMARELKERIVNGAFEHKYSKVDIGVVTISQGVFWGVPDSGHSLWNYLHAADSLLYKVKKKSRNSILLGHSFDSEESGSSAEDDEILVDE